MTSETAVKFEVKPVRHIDPSWIMVIGGGIGDALQCIPFMLAHRNDPIRYFVSSHMLTIGDLFTALDLPIERLAIFTNAAEGNENMVRFAEEGQLCWCPRTHYFGFNPLPIPKRLFERQGRTIGIHLGSSSNAEALRSFQGIPKGALPPKLVQEFINDDLDILLFGSPDELDSYGIIEGANLKWVCCPNIADSLGYVCHCDLLIGSDSAFKTMSSMLRVPTIVWMGGYNDPPRDNNFIMPYVNAGIMATFRYGKLLDDEFKAAMDFTKKQLKAVIR